MEKYELKFTIKEGLVYLAVALGLFLTKDFNIWILSIPLFFTLIRLSFWDLKYCLIPDYLLMFSFFLAFLCTRYDFIEALQNGLIYCGGAFILNEIVSLYLNYVKPLIVNKKSSVEMHEALGSGDMPIIGIIGILFGIENGLNVILTAACLGIIIHLGFKKVIAPFVPSLSLAIFIYFIFEFNIINYLLP